MRFLIFSAMAAIVAGVQADNSVIFTPQPPVIDGKLDDACWRKAKWMSGFTKRKCEIDKTVTQQTEFSIAYDKDNVYVAVRAFDDNMERVKNHPKPDMFGGDTVEIYFAPTGEAFDFYHFAIAPTYGMNMPLYYSEGGLTTPDPYAPDWKYAVDLGEKSWTVEMVVPLKSFYMTRNAEWKDAWRFNVSRVRKFAAPSSEAVELTTWSPNLEYKFPEVKNFNIVKGFPIRDKKDDVSMTAAAVNIDSKKGEKIAGNMSLRIYAAEPGKYIFKSPYCDTTELDLKIGYNEIQLRCAFDGPGRFDVPMELERVSDASRYTRRHSVAVSYQALNIRMEKPQYRNNFYPGQDSSEIKGRCVSGFGLPVQVTLEGKNFKKTTVNCGADGSFGFKTPNMKTGDELYLVFTAGDDVKKVKVRKLPKPRRRATWIEDGNIILDGKPIFRRNMYGWNKTGGYRCSKQYMERVRRDGNLNCTMKLVPEDLQFSRLVRGSKQTEGNRDVMPSKKVFDAIEKRINELKDTDFGYYYIMDEPECGGVSPVYMRHIYEFICEKDPYHLTFMCSQAVDRFIDAADCLEPHPYLTPRYNDKGEREYPRPMYTMGAPADRFQRHNRKDKVLGVTPAAFAFRELSRNYDYPTFDEYLANTWAMILGGAKTVYPFILDCAGHRAALYEGTRYMFTSIEALEEYLLHGKRKRLVKNKNHEAVIWTLDDKKMFAVLNYNPAPQTVKVKGIEGNYFEFRGDRKWSVPSLGEIELSMRPFELIIGTTEKCDGALVPRADVERKIASLEWARTHRDNQIFEKDSDIKMSVNGRIPTQLTYSLVDGVRDAESMMVRGKSPTFELQFLKEPITFRQIRLFGHNSITKGFSAEIFFEGKWKKLDVSASEKGEYEVFVTLPETVKAQKLRFTFNTNVTLHEIEIPRLWPDGDVR